MREPDSGERFGGPPAPLTNLDAGVQQPVGDVLERRGVLGQEELLEDEPDAATDRGATLTLFRSTLERLLAISEQQGRLLEALLTLASSERGLDRREPFDLSELTDQVLRTRRTETDRLGLRIEARIAPAPTSGDPALVERLVANLLDNAVRYNVAGGQVEVATATRAERALLSIANTGPVIPPTQVDRLFEPFQRLGDRTTQNDGHHGLGLSIVRAIAAAHDATLTAYARPEGGLAVEVGFPVSEAHWASVVDEPEPVTDDEALAGQRRRPR